MSHRHTRLLDRLRQMERIGGRAAEHRAAEVLERDELALGEPPDTGMTAAPTASAP